MLNKLDRCLGFWGLIWRFRGPRNLRRGAQCMPFDRESLSLLTWHSISQSINQCGFDQDNLKLLETCLCGLLWFSEQGVALSQLKEKKKTDRLGQICLLVRKAFPFALHGPSLDARSEIKRFLLLKVCSLSKLTYKSPNLEAKLERKRSQRSFSRKL